MRQQVSENRFNLSNVATHVIYFNETGTAPGLTHYECAFFDLDGRRIQAHIAEIDLGNPDIHIDAALPDNGDDWGMQRTTDMAKAASTIGHRVVCAVNGDFYTMTSGEPEGVFVKHGRIFKDTMLVGKNFFGIMKNGMPVIGNESLFCEIKNNLHTAVGGRNYLVKNGEINSEEMDSDGIRHPRTAVGILRDRKVIIAVVDGRRPGISEGFDIPNLAAFMKALGAVDALNLDGGGSATFAARIPGMEEITVVNSVSDGEERECANSLLIVSTAPEDHRFASCRIEPFDIAITPGGYVDYRHAGIDASGAPAQTPLKGFAWSVSNPEYGTIDERGHFISGRKEGTTKIVLKYNEKVVGYANLQISLPDILVLEEGPAAVIPGNSRKNLRPVGKRNGRDIVVQPHQIIWDVPENLGHIDENGFLCTGNVKTESLVKATLKDTAVSAEMLVRIGQIPVTLYDFECDDQIDSWSCEKSTGNPGATGYGACLVRGAVYPAEPVKTGEKSLSIDFALYKSAIQIGPQMGKCAIIPHRPSAIGLWVYFDESMPRIELYGKLTDGENRVVNLHFTGSNKMVCNGWNYVQAPIPDTYLPPFSFHPGSAIVLDSTTDSYVKGKIYIDNIRAVYDENNDDVTLPEVKKIDIIRVPGSEKVNIKAWLAKDLKNPHATKINYNRIRIFVDGAEYTNLKGHYGLNKGNNTVMLDGLEFSKGTHCVKVWFQDFFGNEAFREELFTVE